MPIPLGWLRWEDCRDPQFTPDTVRAAVEALATEGPRDPARLVQRVTDELVDTVGPWAAGFAWAPNAGGVVLSWCCPTHSVPVGTPPSVVADRVLAALAEWQGVLRELDRQFRGLDDRVRGLPPAQGLRLAAAALLPWVVERTGAEDAWYGTYSTVLSWWLTSTGRDSARYERLLDRVISGRFASWVAPTDAVAEQVCTDLGSGLAALDDEPAQDGLQAWTVTRGFGATPPRPSYPAGPDAHLRVLRTLEAQRDPARAARMQAALLTLRDHTAAGHPLDRAVLTSTNATVLGRPARLRSTDAWAKGGSEWYPLPADLPRQLDRWLSDARDPTLPLSRRAVRLYLDLCFLHPFEDGNARTARLALDALLWGAGLHLGMVGGMFSLERAPDDGPGAEQWVWVLEASMRRRA